jgi:hypothetical protein
MVLPYILMEKSVGQDLHTARHNENIGQVARGHHEKQMVADGWKDTLYVVST